MSLERTIRQMMMVESKDVVEVIGKPSEETLSEDGHTDVASSKRKCKTIVEDAQAILSALESMDDEGSLPTWWTNKLAVASNDMNKMNDYISNPTEMKEEKDGDYILEAVKYPHMMYDPKTGKEVEAKSPEDHEKYAEMGYTHEKPENDEEDEMDEAKVRGKEVYDKTFANRTQADNYAKKHGGRVQQVGRVFYVFKEEVELKEEDAETHGDERDYHHQKAQEFERKAQQAKSRGDDSGYNAAAKMARYHKDAGDDHGRVVKHFQSGNLAHAQKRSAQAYNHSDDVERRHAELKKHLPEGLEEKKDEPPFDVSKADYKGAAKELTQYAMTKGGMDKNDFLGFANRMSAIAGKKSPRVTARFARDLEALDTSPREKIISVMRNNGIKVTMAGRGLKIEDLSVEDWDFLASLNEAYKTPSEASAYEAGKKAVAKKISYDDNPNKKGTKEYTAWSKGHNDARAKMIGKRFSKEEVELQESPMVSFTVPNVDFAMASKLERLAKENNVEYSRKGRTVVLKGKRIDITMIRTKMGLAQTNIPMEPVKEEVELEEAKGETSAVAIEVVPDPTHGADDRTSMITGILNKVNGANRQAKDKKVLTYRRKINGKDHTVFDGLSSSIEQVKKELKKGGVKMVALGSKTKPSPTPSNSVVMEARDPSKSGGSGYDLYHKDFSTAMAHAYKYAKDKLGIEIDPKEIDDKVASGPRKPSSGKTNTYRLKGKDGKKAVQIQVANLDNKKYELNMYKEEVELEEKFKVGDKVKVKKGTLKSPDQRHYETKAGTIVKDYKDGEFKINFGGNDDFSIDGKFLVKESVELDEAMRVLATKGKTKVVTKGDGVARVMVGNKEIASGDLDDGAGGWFMSKKGDKGQKFFDSPKKIADFYAEALHFDEYDLKSKSSVIKSVLKKNGVDPKNGYSTDKGYSVDVDNSKARKIINDLRKDRVFPEIVEQKLTVGQSIMEKAIARIREAEGEKMTDAEMKKRDEIMKGLEKKKDEFEKRYGDRAKEVMARTAIKMAKGD